MCVSCIVGSEDKFVMSFLYQSIAINKARDEMVKRFQRNKMREPSLLEDLR